MPGPPYRMKVVSDTGEVGPEIKVYGKIMGKDEGKHVRLYDKETSTAYIRWYANSNLRLFIADKNPRDVLYVHVKQMEKKNRDGKEEKYMFVTKNTILRDGGIVS